MLKIGTGPMSGDQVWKIPTIPTSPTGNSCSMTVRNIYIYIYIYNILYIYSLSLYIYTLSIYILYIYYIYYVCIFNIYIYILIGGFNLSETYMSQIGSSSQLLGKQKMFHRTATPGAPWPDCTPPGWPVLSAEMGPAETLEMLIYSDL